MYGTEQQRKAIDWQSLRAADKLLFAIHPNIDLSGTATIPDGMTIVELMRVVMSEHAHDLIECESCAVLPFKGKWRIGGVSKRGVLREKPPCCHANCAELVFWPSAAILADEAMRRCVPDDLLDRIDWWLVGIDPMAKPCDE